MTNPFLPLVPALADGRRAAAPPARQFRWAWVAQVSPLRIRYATDPEPVDADVTTLAPAAVLQVGQQVLVLQHGGELVVLGPVGSAAAVWQPLVLAAPWEQYQSATSWGAPAVCVRDGVVRLRGMVTGGVTGTSSEPLAVLPVWARPARTRIGSCIVSDEVVTFQVGPNGALHLRGALTSGWVSLSSITFPL